MAPASARNFIRPSLYLAYSARAASNAFFTSGRLATKSLISRALAAFIRGLPVASVPKFSAS